MKGSREVILRIAAAHKDKRALDILGMELAYVSFSSCDFAQVELVRYIHRPGNYTFNVVRSCPSLAAFRLLFRVDISQRRKTRLFNPKFPRSPRLPFLSRVSPSLSLSRLPSSPRSRIGSPPPTVRCLCWPLR